MYRTRVPRVLFINIESYPGWLELPLIGANFHGLKPARDTEVPRYIVFKKSLYHWLGAYRTNALYSGHIIVRFNDLEDVFT